MACNDSPDCKNVIKKKTRGIDDAGFGEDPEMLRDKLVIKSIVVDKEVYAIGITT